LWFEIGTGAIDIRSEFEIIAFQYLTHLQ